MGTNTGGAPGQPANGKRVEIIGQHTIRFAGGQIGEKWTRVTRGRRESELATAPGTVPGRKV